MPRPKPGRDASVGELYLAGRTYAEIAAQLDVSPGVVAAAMRRLRASGSDLPSRKAPLWSQAEDLQLVSVLEAGGDLDSAATDLGRTAGAAGKRLRLLVMDGRASADLLADSSAWSQCEDEQIVTGYRDGRTLEQMAERLGRPIGTVFGRLEQLRRAGEDLVPRKPRWTDAERQRLAKRYREGASYNQLAAEFGKAKGTISRQLLQMRDAGIDLEREKAT